MATREQRVRDELDGAHHTASSDSDDKETDSLKSEDCKTNEEDDDDLDEVESSFSGTNELDGLPTLTFHKFRMPAVGSGRRRLRRVKGCSELNVPLIPFQKFLSTADNDGRLIFDYVGLSNHIHDFDDYNSVDEQHADLLARTFLWQTRDTGIICGDCVCLEVWKT